uniref:glycosyl hydrolase n=1 Tax=Persicitalea sp. TaxID=3100273 RepID=UPI003593D7FE
PEPDPAFDNTLSRVRYDYNRLLVRLFMKNFVEPFQQFSTENGVKGRYQSYGTPLLMGMMEGNLIPDIPEGNNWIYSVDMETDEWSWNQAHGYLIWNLYAAVGGHLKGRKIISCEAMTNTKGVFKTSLEEIKRHDDMNFITGINHTILHGYNYSPPAAGFPGWIRYGAYFSEQNTWWPYLNHWADYNARLSSVFQQSSPVKKLALLGPIPDIWSQKGLIRVPVHSEPAYFHHLWESISQAGSSCDYIDETIIREGDVSSGTLKYGPMTYEAIVLGSVQSLDPATATALLRFVQQGGKLVVIDELPHRSLSQQNALDNDRTVIGAFAEIQNKYASQLIQVKSPSANQDLLIWTTKLLADAALTPDVQLVKPDKNVFQIRQVAGERDIYFFVNSNSRKAVTLQANFPMNGKTPWLWNPETGTRHVLAASASALPITLAPLKSKLIVFEPTRTDTPKPLAGHHEPGRSVGSIDGPWQVQFTHANGTVFSRSFDKLSSFGISTDRQLSTFAGTATYTTAFTATGTECWLELPNTYKGVSEVYVNGKKMGLNWYGRPLFLVSGALRKGRNTLEIKYTTVLSNYARSLTENATAARWTQGFEAIPLGLDGKITLYATE